MRGVPPRAGAARRRWSSCSRRRSTRRAGATSSRGASSSPSRRRPRRARRRRCRRPRSSGFPRAEVPFPLDYPRAVQAAPDRVRRRALRRRWASPATTRPGATTRGCATTRSSTRRTSRLSRAIAGSGRTRIIDVGRVARVRAHGRRRRSGSRPARWRRSRPIPDALRAAPADRRDGRRSCSASRSAMPTLRHPRIGPGPRASPSRPTSRSSVRELSWRLLRGAWPS